jgi:copper ion binding protein
MKKTFQVLDMHCSNCAMRIESIEDELPGVKSVSASYQKGQVVVEYDEQQVTPEAIVTAVKKQGYTARL